jgi:hypothetical protein
MIKRRKLKSAVDAIVPMSIEDQAEFRKTKARIKKQLLGIRNGGFVTPVLEDIMRQVRYKIAFRELMFKGSKENRTKNARRHTGKTKSTDTKARKGSGKANRKRTKR